MVNKIGTLSAPGTLVIPSVQRYEHHKIYLKVTSYTSTITIVVEDVSLGEAFPIDLHSSGTFTITGNGAYGYQYENARCDDLRLNLTGGSATVEVFYNGW